MNQKITALHEFVELDTLLAVMECVSMNPNAVTKITTA